MYCTEIRRNYGTDVEIWMDPGEDEQSSEDSKKIKLELNTRTGSSADGVSDGSKLNDTLPRLPASPVIADKGTMANIEGTAPFGLVLPFETQVQGHIGRQLRALYDHVLEQPIPDRFVTLLRQLDDASETRPGSPGADGLARDDKPPDGTGEA